MKSGPVNIQIAAGVISYQNKLTGGVIFTFYADMKLDEGVLNLESALDYNTVQEAESAALDFTTRFPIAYNLCREDGLKLLTEFKMTITPHDATEHPAIVTTRPRDALH